MAHALTKKESTILRVFQQQVDRLRNSSVIKQQKVTITKTWRTDLVTGEKMVTFSGYSQELFQSQLPILRQFIMEKEKINFRKICDLVDRKCMRPELQQWIAAARRLWKEQLKSLPSLREKKMTTATLEQSLNKLFYGFGGLFHAGADKAEQSSSVAAIEEALIHKAFPHLFRCLNIVDSVIWWWHDERAANVPTVSEINARKKPKAKRKRRNGEKR